MHHGDYASAEIHTSIPGNPPRTPLPICVRPLFAAGGLRPWNSQRPRPCLARSLGYLHSAHRWSPIGPLLQTFAQLLNACVQVLFEFLRRLAIDTACAPTIHLLPGLSEKLRCEQMRQRGEAYLPI